MSEYSELLELLEGFAREFGDGIELQDRRGFGVVGISIYSLDHFSGAYPSAKTEWIHEIDDMTFAEALVFAKDYIASIRQSKD